MFHTFDKVNSTTIWGLLHAKNTLTSSYFLKSECINQMKKNKQKNNGPEDTKLKIEQHEPPHIPEV
jgi:hypothetical protein